MSHGVQEKQQKQEKIRKAQQKLRIGQEKQNLATSPQITLEQAEQQIFAYTKQGRNYREIAQYEFNIIGIGFKRFSISQISKIRVRFENNTIQEKTSTNKNNNKTEMFRLLRQGCNLQDIVMNLNIEPQEVKSTYYEYLDLNGISANTINTVLKKIKSWNKKFQNDIDLGKILDQAFEDSYFVDNLYYHCMVCKKPVHIGPHRSADWMNDLADGLVMLGRNHWHLECDSPDLH